MDKKLTVDRNKCVHCGLCVKDCMMGCIEFDGEKIPQYGAGGKERCVACQHCMAVCPTGAMSFGGKNPDASVPVGYGDSDALMTLIKSRRSVRAYRQEDIPAEKLEKIKEMLAYPPTGSNAKSLHLSIVGSRKKMEEIKKISYDTILSYDNPSPIMKFCAESYRNGQDIVYRNAPSMIAASVDKKKATAGCETVDPIIALSYLELYAQSLGLGTLWDDLATFVLTDIPEALALLELPEGYDLSFVLLMGVPAVKYKRVVQKEPSVKIV